MKPVSVVIPVYNAPAELELCLASVYSTVPADTEVLVIDDASPDTSTASVLHRWQEQAPAGWRFLANSESRGFVGTANRA